jgi:hypothetical protein
MIRYMSVPQIIKANVKFAKLMDMSPLSEANRYCDDIDERRNSMGSFNTFTYSIPHDLSLEVYGRVIKSIEINDKVFNVNFAWLMPVWYKLERLLNELPVKWRMCIMTGRVYWDEYNTFLLHGWIDLAYKICVEVYEFLEIIGSLD